MGVINILSFILISLVLLLEVYTNFYKPPKVEKKEIRTKVEKNYYITLPADFNFAEQLLKKKVLFSYTPQGIFLTLHSTQEVENILKLYKTYKLKKEREKIAKGVVINFIKEDLSLLRKEYKETLQDYQKLYGIFASRGVKISFEILKPQILAVQQKTYEGYIRYWEQKLQQIEKNFTIEVNRPNVDVSALLQKAKTIYTDELKFNLFQLYLNIKVLESNIAADLYKLNEFSSQLKNNP